MCVFKLCVTVCGLKKKFFVVFIKCDESSVCSTVQKLPEVQEDEDDEDHDTSKPVDCWNESTNTHVHTSKVYLR